MRLQQPTYTTPQQTNTTRNVQGDYHFDKCSNKVWERSTRGGAAVQTRCQVPHYVFVILKEIKEKSYNKNVCVRVCVLL